MKFAVVVYAYYPDENGGTYNPVAFKLTDGTVKTTVRQIGEIMKILSPAEIMDELQNGHDLIVMPMTDETAIKQMKLAINPRKTVSKDANSTA